MSKDDLSFSQREGIEPILEPMPPKTLSKDLRNALWHHVFVKLNSSVKAFNLQNNWEAILGDYHVNVLHKASDEFKMINYTTSGFVKNLILESDYNEVFDFLEYVFNHKCAPDLLAREVSQALNKFKASYVVLKTGKLVHFARRGIKGEYKTEIKFMKDSEATRFKGVHEHLHKSMEALRRGNSRESIEESFRSVEAALVVLTKEVAGDLVWALDDCAEMWHIDLIFKDVLSRHFAYKMEGDAVRHFILDQSENVDDIEAQYFLGSCTAFVSYLIHKSRRAYRY
ncbi:MAG: hypothetical protein ACI9S8_002916 [Chlamydiales bacterium]|jgi:hypothetical protein